MIIDDIINVAADCSASEIKTGRNGGCSLKMSNLRHFFLTATNFRIPLGTDIDDAAFTAYEAAGNIISLANVKDVQYNPAEDTYITDARGIKTLDVPGLPEFVLVFEESHQFYKELHKLTSYGNYNVMMADDDNTLALANQGAEGWSGFEAGHVTVSSVTPKVPGASESISVTIQLIDRNQWDEDKDLMVVENHGIVFRNHSGVSPMLVSHTVIPANLGTTLQVKVTLGDGKTAASGLLTGDFETTVNGVVTAVTWTEVGSTGVYDGTIAALATGEVVAVGTNGIITLLSKLYKADKVSVTVVA